MKMSTDNAVLLDDNSLVSLTLHLEDELEYVAFGIDISGNQKFAKVAANLLH